MLHCKTAKLGDLAVPVASAFYPAATQLYRIGDIPFVRCVDCINYPIITKEQDEEFEKIPYQFGRESKGISFLKTNDIVITKVGSPCYASIITEYSEIALSRTVMGLTSIHSVEPYYLMIFLRCKYGFEQLYRQRELTIQYQLTLSRVKDINIFLPSDQFQKKIQKLCILYIGKLNYARQIYIQAEQLLLSKLDLLNYSAPTEEVSTKLLSESFLNSGRLDAEYYQPKYDEIEKILRSFKTVPIGSSFDEYKNTCSDYCEKRQIGVVKTKQLTNWGINEKTESYLSLQSVKENSLTLLQKGDVVFASMGVGSLGKTSIYYGSKLLVTDSTLKIFRRKNNGMILPEVLMLFLQSNIGQEMIYKYVVGSTGIINIYDKDINRISIPLLDSSVQQILANSVQKSFVLRDQSEQLLETAKHAVEVAIEKNESEALKCLELSGIVQDF